MARQTLEEKASGFIKSIMINGGLSSADILKKHLINLLKEQDRDTRHACAEAFSLSDDLSKTYSEIMNCRGGIE